MRRSSQRDRACLRCQEQIPSLGAVAAPQIAALNPVKAGLVTQATAWPWSSAAPLAARRNDVLVKVRPVLKRIGDLAEFMGLPEDSDLRKALERGLSVGRPLMAMTAMTAVEWQLGVSLIPRKRGPRPAQSRERTAKRV